jgi:CHAT domain-containing protein
MRDFSAAEAAGARIGDPDLLWQIYYGRARTQEARGDRAAAINSLLAAVSVIESVRNQLQEPRFRAGYVEDKYDVYVELVRLQLEQGSTADAFSTAERLRARSYTEQLGGRSALPLSAEDRQRETQLRERVRQLQRGLADQDDQGQPKHPERALSRFSAELAAAEKDYQAFLDDHAGARPDNDRPAVDPGAASVQAALAADEALVEYVVGADQLMAFVLTAGNVTAVTLPVRRVDLGARIALLRDLIRHPGDERWQKPADRLAELLIRPLERGGQLRDIRRLYIVPHNALNYLPFALLPSAKDSRDVLVDRYTVAYLPAAAALLVAPRAMAPALSALAVAPARGQLRYAPEEARAVGALFQPNSRLLLGTVATEGRVKQLAGDYGVVHLATHGYFDKSNPLLSGLELERDATDDGLLQVHEILDLRLHAELVTLSACETGLGSGYFADLPASDEFVGMTRAFLGAGSTSVLATLWDVDDQASVQLMKQFYGHLNAGGATHDAATALAQVQRELHASRQLAHPYYWAPFILVGAAFAPADRSELTARRTP